MATVEVARSVDAPVERVWQVFTDLENRAVMLSSVAAVEVISEGPFGVGSAWRESRRLPGGNLAIEELQVTSCDPPFRCVVESRGSGADYRITYDFAEHTRRGTKMRACFEGMPRGVVGKLVAALFGGLATGIVEGALRRDLDDLATAATT